MGFGRRKVSEPGRSVMVMEEQLSHLDDLELVAVMHAVLDALTDDRLRLASDRDRLAVAHEAVRLTSRVTAWQTALIAGVENDQVAARAHGTSTATWLAEVAQYTRNEAATLVRNGQQWRRFPQVADAVNTGRTLPAQATAITSVLDHLPGELPVEQLAEAEELMVGFAESHNSTELRRLARHLLDVIAPEIAEATETDRLERELRDATRNRFFSFTPDHAGSVLLRGSLPHAHAETVRTVIEAFADQIRRGAEAIDPASDLLTPGMRRADALHAMAQALQRAEATPTHGGDRPRAVIHLDWNTLHTTAQAAQAAHAAQAAQAARAGRAGHPQGADPATINTQPDTTATDTTTAPHPHTTTACPAATLQSSGERIAPSLVRQWLCDCDILPIVFNGESIILDAGRTRRLIPPELRTVLEARDRGCIFAGCPAPPPMCHAHHLVPWWAGGPTNLTNLVLVCPHHHGVVEPSPHPNADLTQRWRAHLPPNGPPHVIPPHTSTPPADPAPTPATTPPCAPEP